MRRIYKMFALIQLAWLIASLILPPQSVSSMAIGSAQIPWVESSAQARHDADEFDPFIATASDIQRLRSSNDMTSVQLVNIYLEEIAKNNGHLRAVTALPPREWLLREAERLDEERRNGQIRSPFHGVPILLKVSEKGTTPIALNRLTTWAQQDAIDTDTALEMSTTWGSLALAGTHPKRGAKVADFVSPQSSMIVLI